MKAWKTRDSNVHDTVLFTEVARLWRPRQCDRFTTSRRFNRMTLCQARSRRTVRIFLRLAMGLPCRSAAEHAPLSTPTTSRLPPAETYYAAAYKRHQIRVPRLQGERGHGHGRLSGLHGASVR